LFVDSQTFDVRKEFKLKLIYLAASVIVVLKNCLQLLEIKRVLIFPSNTINLITPGS